MTEAASYWCCSICQPPGPTKGTAHSPEAGQMADTARIEDSGATCDRQILEPYPAKEMICWPGSVRVGNVRNYDPSLIEPMLRRACTQTGQDRTSTSVRDRPFSATPAVAVGTALLAPIRPFLDRSPNGSVGASPTVGADDNE